MAEAFEPRTFSVTALAAAGDGTLSAQEIASWLRDQGLARFVMSRSGHLVGRRRAL